MDASGRTARCLDPKIEFSPRVIKSVSDIRDGKGALQAGLNLILNTFYLANNRRRGPKGKVTHFSVNIGDKGTVKLIRVRAITTFDIDRKAIAIDLPEAEEPIY